jgi:hypothetical protein
MPTRRFEAGRDRGGETTTSIAEDSAAGIAPSGVPFHVRRRVDMLLHSCSLFVCCCAMLGEKALRGGVLVFLCVSVCRVCACVCAARLPACALRVRCVCAACCSVRVCCVCGSFCDVCKILVQICTCRQYYTHTVLINYYRKFFLQG